MTMKQSLNYTILAAVLILTSFGSFAQSNSDISKVLKSAFKENNVKFKSEKSYQLSSLDYSVPLLEKVEVRSETNDFDLRQQDLTVRVSPNNSSSRKAHRLYHESVEYMAEMELNTEIMKALFSKYILIKEYVFAKEKLDVQKKKNMVAKDKLKLLKRMISLTSFDIVDLIEAEDELYELQREIQDTENSLAQLTFELNKILVGQEITLEVEELISVQRIKELILSENKTKRISHPEEEVLSARHYNAMMEHDWEKSKNKFSLGFLQASYGYKPDEPFRNTFSLGFGFDIPTKGSSGLELNEIKVDIIDAQNEYQNRVEELELSKQNNRARLLSLIRMYELLSLQIEEGNAEHALQEYSKHGVATPQALIRLKELSINNEFLLIEIWSDILKIYLDYIYVTGDMGRKPYQNFLDTQLTFLH